MMARLTASSFGPSTRPAPARPTVNQLTTSNLAVTAPDAPRDFGAALTDNPGEVRLTWNDPNPYDSTITGWQYKQREYPDAFPDKWTELPGGPDVREAVVPLSGPQLDAMSRYGFKVRAVNSAVTSDDDGKSSGEQLVYTRSVALDVPKVSTSISTVDGTTIEIADGEVQIGTAVSYTVKLTGKQPTSDVIIEITGKNARVHETGFRFVPSDWNSPQTVSFTAQSAKVTISHKAYSHDPGFHDIFILDITTDKVRPAPPPPEGPADSAWVRPGSRARACP